MSGMSADSPRLRNLLQSVAVSAAAYADTLAARPCAPSASSEDLTRALGRELPEKGEAAEKVLSDLLRDAEGGLVATGNPRHFGFVFSGTLDSSLAADWLSSAWDQNGQVYATSPAAAVVETIVAGWLLELLGLPADSSVGFVTGGQMANFTALACARDAVLERAGWPASEKGLFGAPVPALFASECVHGTVLSALKMAGFGTAQLRSLPADCEGRLRLPELKAAVKECSGRPMILSLQAGNVNTGAFEPVSEIAEIVRGENAWLHVDGAFGLWAAVSPELRGLVPGLTLADSWSTDAHKWLNVPCDSGIVIVKDPVVHRRLKASRCSYAGEEDPRKRDGSAWTPENSRRARGFVLYAALRELGKSGVRALVERCCALARRFAEGASALPRVRVENEVCLNQVLLSWELPSDVDPTLFHRTLAARLQTDGRCWLGTTIWRGRTLLRFSVCNFRTGEKDIDLTLAALAEVSERTLADLTGSAPVRSL